MKDDIMEAYYYISEIIGHDTLQKLIPLQQSTALQRIQSPPHPFVLLFYLLLIKLLSVATLGSDSVNTYDTYCLVDRNQLQCVCSHTLMVSSAALKKQVEAFRDKALSEDHLCSSLIATLTVDDN